MYMYIWKYVTITGYRLGLVGFNLPLLASHISLVTTAFKLKELNFRNQSLTIALTASTVLSHFSESFNGPNQRKSDLWASVWTPAAWDWHINTYTAGRSRGVKGSDPAHGNTSCQTEINLHTHFCSQTLQRAWRSIQTAKWNMTCSFHLILSSRCEYMYIYIKLCKCLWIIPVKQV